MENIQDLSDANAQSAAEFVLTMVRTHVPNSSTKLSLDHQGYLESGLIEQTIRTYRQLSSYPYQAAVKALESGCGNCQEMAYLGVLILRAAGFKGQISIGQYGLNHQFLFIEDLIVDPWAGFYCLNSMWKNNINAYGGSIKEGVMYGRLVSPEHDEMEDEEPEVVEDIPLSYNPGLSVDAVKVYLYRKNVEECHQAMPHFFTKK